MYNLSKTKLKYIQKISEKVATRSFSKILHKIIQEKENIVMFSVQFVEYYVPNMFVNNSC